MVGWGGHGETARLELARSWGWGSGWRGAGRPKLQHTRAVILTCKLTGLMIRTSTLLVKTAVNSALMLLTISPRAEVAGVHDEHEYLGYATVRFTRHSVTVHSTYVPCTIKHEQRWPSVHLRDILIVCGVRILNFRISKGNLLRYDDTTNGERYRIQPWYHFEAVVFNNYH